MKCLVCSYYINSKIYENDKIPINNKSKPLLFYAFGRFECRKMITKTISLNKITSVNINHREFMSTHAISFNRVGKKKHVVPCP